MYVCIYVYMRYVRCSTSRNYTCIHTIKYIHTCIRAQIHTCIHCASSTAAQILLASQWIHTHIHTHIHTYMHTYIQWRKLYDSTDPAGIPMPGGAHEKYNSFQKICILRCLRPDKVVPVVQQLVIDEMGQRYVEPPPVCTRLCVIFMLG